MKQITTVILDSQEAIKEFQSKAAQMDQVEYDIEEVITCVFGNISGDPSLRQEVSYAHTVENLSDRDLMLLSLAVDKLEQRMELDCKRLGVYDENGRLGFRPTAWLGQYDIVLTRDDLPGGMLCSPEPELS